MTTSRDDDRPPVRIGDMRVSFTMQPCGPDGYSLHGGNHYANADTLEAAHAYAYRVLTTPPGQGFCCMRGVRSVKIIGATYEFTGDAWTPRYSRENFRYHETVTPDDIPPDYTRPAPYSGPAG